jgi:alanyl-tRNA synthetase
MPTSNEVRRQFLDFFQDRHGHTVVPSSPVVPRDDPTLLFTNAGMNQFKDVFLGTSTRSYTRAVDTQKCIRAGGKHNDLDDVGRDTYHHTFFEMLGNWSFGDYFKKEAIGWAWELLTKVWGLDKSRLHATVFQGDPETNLGPDDEAAGLWRSETDIDPSHIHFFSRQDNFWEMGETGPCGPCTEIHYDRTPDKSGGKLVNAGSSDVIEIWNLVFIQFNRNPDKSLTPLKAKHVDTGMGFERVTAVLQGKASNYDTDVFTPIFDSIQKVTGAPKYTGKLDDLKDTAYRVIADHIRALTFALTDGAEPSNIGRGYVLRSILRRAERYGWQQFGTKQPFLHELVPTVVDQMGGVFPELKQNPRRVAEMIRDEETGFLRTLDRGLKLFQKAADRARSAGGVIIGKDAFDLHTEQGLFIDITEQMAGEAGLRVDRDEYQRLFDEFTGRTGLDRKRFVIAAVKGDLPATDDSPKYDGHPIDAKLLGWVQDNAVVREGTLKPGESVALLIDKTIFYAEQGGQVGDRGTVHGPAGDFDIEDTQRLGEAVLHIGSVREGTLTAGESVRLAVVPHLRNDTMRNHTATHLLNLTLRQVLGDGIEQKGSLVDAEKTRFDFSFNRPLTNQEVAEVERIVNEKINADLPVHAELMPLAEASNLPGVRKVFGDKYPDPVRVLMIGPENAAQASVGDSVEFCGGTHLRRTGQAGLFKVVGQEAVGKGVRRLTAVTGPKATEVVRTMTAVLDDLTERFRCRPEELPARVESLQEEVKRLHQQLRKGTATDLTGAADKLLAEAVEVNGAKVVIGEMPPAPVEAMRQQIDRLRQKAGSSVIVVGWKDDEGKVPLLVAVTNDLVAKGVKAGDIIRPVAEVVGGKGGGKPELAQAGGKDAAKLPEALATARRVVEEMLAKPPG